MGDRFFLNEMPDYIPETETPDSGTAAAADSLTRLLHLPFKTLSDELVKSGLGIKDAVVRETWLRRGGRVDDYTLYTGALGTAYLLFKAYQVGGNKNDIALCSEIIKACESASRRTRQVTFICGRAGVCALGAVVAHYSGDKPLCDQYLTRFNDIKLPNDLPDELLYGRAGFLWACSFLNKNIGEGTISSAKMRSVVDEMVRSGRKLGSRQCPLMFEWHEKKYWGAAHGLAGILNVLLDMDLNPDEAKYVKDVLHHMIKHRFPGGNYPSSEGSETDRLVHWCHGAPGIALTLVKAAKVFDSEEFIEAAIDAAQVVWKRGLLKRVGICHGISGSAYVFLSLYQLTRKPEFLYRAKAFSCFLLDRAEKLISKGAMHGGDRPYSLFEGIGGMSYLFFDITEPSQARFPAYQL